MSGSPNLHSQSQYNKIIMEKRITLMNQINKNIKKNNNTIIQWVRSPCNNELSMLSNCQNLLPVMSQEDLQQISMNKEAYEIILNQQKELQRQQLIFKTSHTIKINIMVNKVKQKFKSLVNLRIKQQKLFNLINDKTLIYGQDQTTSVKQCCKQVVVWYNKIPVLKPDNQFLNFWELLVFAGIISQIIFIPIKVTFELPYSKNDVNLWIFGYFSILVFSLDIILMFNASFYKQGILIKDKVEIAKHYLHNYFLYDFISLLSLILVLVKDIEMLETGFLFRGLQVKARLDKLNQFYQLKQRFGVFYELVVLVCLILIMAHLLGCGFYQTGNFERYHGRRSWLDVIEEQIELDGLIDKYIITVYFTFVSMITVGYGDVTPYSTNERLYVILMALISTGIFGYTINKVSNIFSSLIEQKQQIENNQMIIQTYCLNRNINPSIQYKMLVNIEQLGQKKQGINKEGYDLIQQLEPQLQQEFKTQYFGNILQNIQVLNKQFTQNALEEFATKMEEINLQKGETLFVQNQEVDQLQFLVSGQIKIFDKNFSLPIKYINGNQTLYLNQFYIQGQFSTTGQCSKDCRIVSIKFTDFIDIIKKSQQNYETYCKIKDNILLENYFFQSGESCEYCHGESQLNHQLQMCNQIHLRTNKILTVTKDQYPVLKRNKQFVRKNNKKINAIKYNTEIRQELKEVRLEQVYILYGFELLPTEFDEIVYNQDQAKYDRQFFKMIPKILKNFIDTNKLEIIKETGEFQFMELEEEVQDENILNDDLNLSDQMFSLHSESSQSEQQKQSVFNFDPVQNFKNSIKEEVDSNEKCLTPCKEPRQPLKNQIQGNNIIGYTTNTNNQNSNNNNISINNNSKSLQQNSQSGQQQNSQPSNTQNQNNNTTTKARQNLLIIKLKENSLYHNNLEIIQESNAMQASCFKQSNSNLHQNISPAPQKFAKRQQSQKNNVIENINHQTQNVKMLCLEQSRFLLNNKRKSTVISQQQPIIGGKNQIQNNSLNPNQPQQQMLQLQNQQKTEIQNFRSTELWLVTKLYLDRMKNYDIYMQHNNYQLVLQRANKKYYQNKVPNKNLPITYNGLQAQTSENQLDNFAMKQSNKQKNSNYHSNLKNINLK